VLAAAAALCVIVLAARGRRGVPVPAAPGGPAPFGVAGAPPAAPGQRVGARAAVPGAPPLPASLVGTQPDGALVTDASGAFVPTRDALDLFDYYLAAIGEEPLETIVGRIERAIRERLDPPDAALELLARYLAYREEVRRLVATEGLDALSLERRAQLLRELRRGVFGAELAERLFGEEEDRVRQTLAWRRVATDPSLAPEERAERLAASEAELPERVQERRARATVAQRLLVEEAALRAEGASDGEIQALREQRFGANAAARLAALDRSRAEWDARVAAYREERARLEAEPFSDAAARDAEIEVLRARHFAGSELVRIRALDAIAASVRADDEAAVPQREGGSRSAVP